MQKVKEQSRSLARAYIDVNEIRMTFPVKLKYIGKILQKLFRELFVLHILMHMTSANTFDEVCQEAFEDLDLYTTPNIRSQLRLGRWHILVMGADFTEFVKCARLVWGNAITPENLVSMFPLYDSISRLHDPVIDLDTDAEATDADSKKKRKKRGKKKQGPKLDLESDSDVDKHRLKMCWWCTPCIPRTRDEPEHIEESKLCSFPWQRFYKRSFEEAKSEPVFVDQC